MRNNFLLLTCYSGLFFAFFPHVLLGEEYLSSRATRIIQNGKTEGIEVEVRFLTSPTDKAFDVELNAFHVSKKENTSDIQTRDASIDSEKIYTTIESVAQSPNGLKVLLFNVNQTKLNIAENDFSRVSFELTWKSPLTGLYGHASVRILDDHSLFKSMNSISPRFEINGQEYSHFPKETIDFDNRSASGLNHFKRTYVRSEYETRSHTVAVPYSGIATDLAATSSSRMELSKKMSQGEIPWVPSPKVKIYYATNRNVKQLSSFDIDRYGIDLNPNGVRYGHCMVSIPVNHHISGRLERPKWYQNADPEKFFLVTDLVDNGKSLSAIQNVMQGSQAGDVLLYVHGFSNTFEDAVLTSARIKHDTKFSGHVVFFSWPSDGKQFDWSAVAAPESLKDPYNRDIRDANQSQAALQQFIIDISLSAKKNNRKMHILAHSLGNRLLFNALSGLAMQKKKIELGHVIFAAADVDQQKFHAGYTQIQEFIETATSYYNVYDKALILSEGVNAGVRLGRMPLNIGPTSNITGIDCRLVDKGIICHGYYVEQSIVLLDIGMLLRGKELGSHFRPISLVANDNVENWMFPAIDH